MRAGRRRFVDPDVRTDGWDARARRRAGGCAQRGAGGFAGPRRIGGGAPGEGTADARGTRRLFLIVVPRVGSVRRSSTVSASRVRGWTPAGEKRNPGKKGGVLP